MAHTCFTASLGTLVVLATTAAAGPDGSRSDGWSITALVGTDVAVDAAAGLQVEAPFRLRVTATAGWMPGIYAYGLRQYYLGAYDGSEPVGELLEDTMSGAFVARGNLGIRPFAGHGFVIAAGYSLVTSEKDGIFASQIEGAGSGLLEDSDRGIDRTFESQIHAHALDAQLGWQWGTGRGFSLRVSLGVVTIVHTTTSFEPNFTPADPALTATITEIAERRLEDAGSGIWAPEASLYLGYTF